jgi:hypothetical protein
VTSRDYRLIYLKLVQAIEEKKAEQPQRAVTAKSWEEVQSTKAVLHACDALLGRATELEREAGVNPRGKVDERSDADAA